MLHRIIFSVAVYYVGTVLTYGIVYNHPESVDCHPNAYNGQYDQLCRVSGALTVSTIWPLYWSYTISARLFTEF